MAHDLALFAQLLAYFVGTLLYGFLARELFERREVLRGWPIRWLAVSLTVWYAGCLVDEELSLLMPASVPLGRLATLLDLVRGFAWLASFPLFAHAVWRTFATEAPFDRERPGRQPPGWWLVPGYLTLFLFVPEAWRTFAAGRAELVVAARAVYPQMISHAVLASAVAVAMLIASLRLAEDRRLKQLLRALLVALAATVGLLAAGGVLLRPDLLGDPDPGTQALGTLLAVTAGLAPGLTFLYFVQRFNLLRLSLSFSSVRHFLGILLLVLLSMFAGPAVGLENTDVFRRLVAWGLLLAVFAGAVYSPLQRRLLERSTWLRSLLGKSITPEALERLTRRFRSLELSEEELRQLTADEVGRWLGARAEFLEAPPAADRETAHLYRAFRGASLGPFNRRDAPTTALATVLERLDLHAVFPLRVGGEVEAVLGLGVSTLGGGYQDGEMEAVQLVARQLGAAIEVRRLLEERVAAERRLAERERLSLLGMVAASLAHELKNPLSSMKALAQTVHEELAARPSGNKVSGNRASGDRAGEQVEDLRLILEQIDRLGEVAREILDFARAPEGDGVELAPLVRSTVYVLGHEARRRGVSIAAAGVMDVGRVRGSRASWQTVLFNLLLNAVQHAPAGSEVVARLGSHADDVVFEVENGGPAIPEEVASRLFEPFVTDRGTGLGLALVAERVRDLGGTIEVTNQPDRIAFAVRVPKGKERCAE